MSLFIGTYEIIDIKYKKAGGMENVAKVYVKREKVEQVVCEK